MWRVDKLAPHIFLQPEADHHVQQSKALAASAQLVCACTNALAPPLLAATPQVTLIDQSERFVFKPLLYELVSGAASEEEVAPHFAQLLGPYPVTFVQGRVHSVQPEHATQVS